MHDVGWPYGRRDGYYNPDSIPDEYLKPHEKKGMRPGSAELVEEGGLNWNLDNAISENGPRNGVLTAVEDFLEETEQEIELVQVPGLHGLGILVPLRLKKQNEKLAEFLEVLDLHPTVSRYIELIEGARLEAEIGWHECRESWNSLVSENRRLNRQLQDIQNSRSWRLASKLASIRARILGRQ